ncbi:MAG: efflux RND transporter permease subunit, partial [Bdellovibrionales bacterium]|nr:efflux RND transporter permease subunit [Bdellovibrionales bacterium]
MKLWELSVKRPIFVSSILFALIVVGLLSLKKLPLEMFPDVTFPIVTVSTIYQGAGPTEVETLVSKPIEEELSGLAGVKVIRSINRESISTVIAEFNLSVDVKYAEQQVRDRVSSAKRKLPDDIEEPIIRKVDPAAQPIMIVAIKSDLVGGELYDLTNETLKAKFEQVNQVGQVEVYGVRKREIQIQLDREKLQRRELSVTQVANALKNSGDNIPAGKITQNQSERVYRTLGGFDSIDDLSQYLISFFGNDVSTRVKDIGTVVDSLEDEKMRAFLNGDAAALLMIYKQSGANTVAVSDAVYKMVDKLNADQKALGKQTYEAAVVRDLARFVRANVFDVVESILFGIALTVLVVFLFLGSVRSTVITGLAIPISLIGSIVFISAAGLTINVMTLLAFSLAVGLLIDDAIVVRENIFRHLEMGKSPVRAALDGTSEVAMAVIAVTLAVIAVFGPIAFLSGVVGQFFKAFGLGVCFVMVVSLFDALTNASMLSAYFGGGHESLSTQKATIKKPVKALLIGFERLQSKLENGYERFLKVVLNHQLLTLVGTLVVVILLGYTSKFIPKTFLPPQDNGEFMISLELKPGTSLEETTRVAHQIEKVVHSVPDVKQSITLVGDSTGASYKASLFIQLIDFKDRTRNTTAVKTEVRELMKEFPDASPTVKDIDMVGAGQRPFVLNIRGQDLDKVREVANKMFAKLQSHAGLLQPELSDKPGLPEFQVKLDDKKALQYGVTASAVGAELRGQVEGIVPAKYRENGLEYDIRVRLAEDQRNLEDHFDSTEVPNVNGRLVRIADFTKTLKETGAATINREDRGRYISIEADVAPNGPGMGGVINDIKQMFSDGTVELPPGVSYRFVGQAENFQELGESIVIAGLLAIVFIFLVLASLYESVVTPFAIMIVIPLAVFGGFFGLFVMGASLDLFSMIGCVMLMGLATKNSIILVDYINQKLEQGAELKNAILEGGKTRLRPILMTSLALIAGMMPVAIGLNEASTQRRSLGIAVVGGVIISTLLTLIVIPAVFSYIELGRRW